MYWVLVSLLVWYSPLGKINRSLQESNNYHSLKKNILVTSFQAICIPLKAVLLVSTLSTIPVQYSSMSPFQVIFRIFSFSFPRPISAVGRCISMAAPRKGRDEHITTAESLACQPALGSLPASTVTTTGSQGLKSRCWGQFWSSLACFQLWSIYVNLGG